MKKNFSTAWKRSKAPRKQRKYRHNAPLHTRTSFMNTMLSKDLAKKYGVGRIRVRSGDKVKVMRGKYRKTEGKVDTLNIKKSTVTITGIERSKKDGSKAMIPLQVSNLMIVDLVTDDKKRFADKSQAPKEKNN
ncbi:50S ribosomal protein L24 [Candidatus Woesearchaeota archaeon]|nr:50S ribosomal protein L24 [Candidatus Woesearchaeota archaeon]